MPTDQLQELVDRFHWVQRRANEIVERAPKPVVTGQQTTETGYPPITPSKDDGDYDDEDGDYDPDDEDRAIAKCIMRTRSYVCIERDEKTGEPDVSFSVSSLDNFDDEDWEALLKEAESRYKQGIYGVTWSMDYPTFTPIRDEDDE